MAHQQIDRIGFIGLGMMGTPMVRRLVQHGVPVMIWNRNPEKAKSLEGEGVTVAGSVRELAQSCSIVFTMVSTSDVVELLAEEIRSSFAQGKIHIDCSTIAPATTRRLASRAAEAGQHFLHCPVLGSSPQAAEGSLLMFLGGRKEARDVVRQYVGMLGKKIYEFDEVTQASNLKLTCNFFIAGMSMTLAQGVAFAEKTGVPGDALLDALSNSALGAPMYQVKGKKMIERSFEPSFFLKHLLKDIRLFADSARDSGINLPFPMILEESYAMADNRGLGLEDYSAVFRIFAEK